jgi:hypothetical protein
MACSPAPATEANPHSTDAAEWEPDALRAADPLLPAHLGTIEARHEGKPGRPLVFLIGESHVGLEVQEAVAHILAYLHRTFDVRVIGSEGFYGPLPVPPRPGAEAARLAAAWASFVDRRHINAVEYVALTLEGVEVHGVSDLAAYEEHGDALATVRLRGENWAGRFARFLEEEVASLRVSAEGGERLRRAFEHAAESGDLEGFGGVLCEVVGRSSKACQECQKLLAEQDELKASSEVLISPDHPLMERRDRALVANTLALPGADRAALVVGYLHVPGVERALQAAGASYLSIVPPGVERDLAAATPMSPEDLEVWQRWDNKTPTSLETWLADRPRSSPDHKPAPALSREGYRYVVGVFDALVLADHLLLTAASEAEVLRILGEADFPAGFEVVLCYQTEDGLVIEFRAGEETGYAVFGDRPAGPPSPEAREIDAGELPGGRYYAVYGGGRGRPPIVPPSLPRPPAGDGPFRRVHIAFERQQRENPGASTIAFQVLGNRVFRFVNGRVRPLPVSPTLLAELRRRLDEQPPGPETLEASQRLAEVLFADLEADLPAEPGTVLYQVSDEDFLGTYSLPFLARLAGHPSASRLDSFTEVYAVPPSAPELDRILSEREPPVEIGRTVVWLSNHLANHPRYREVISAFEAEGAKVNAVPEEGDTLVLLGDPRARWTVTLAEGAERRAGTEAFQADLARASEVVAIGAGLSEEELSRARSVHAVEVTADRVLELGERTVEAMARASGQETLDRTVRGITSEQTLELREVFGTGKGLSRLAESAAAFASEHATVRSRS